MLRIDIMDPVTHEIIVFDWIRGIRCVLNDHSKGCSQEDCLCRIWNTSALKFGSYKKKTQKTKTRRSLCWEGLWREQDLLEFGSPKPSRETGVLARISTVMKRKPHCKDLNGRNLNSSSEETCKAKSLYSDRLEWNSNLDRVWTASRVETAGMNFYWTRFL